MKRVFISIDIPEQIKEEIEGIQNIIPEFLGKKTEKENLHLTLKFLGSVSDEVIVKINERLKDINFSRFDTTIDSLGFFSEKYIRIIWLHLTNCDELQKEIDIVLSGLFEKEKRFMSHLTIARVRQVKNKIKFLDSLKKIRFSEIKFRIDSFRLKESILSSEKPVYKTLAKYDLD